MTAALTVAAIAFAVASGVNDGGAIVALGLKVPGIEPGVAVLILAGSLIVGPIVLGTRVASTVAHELVPFSGRDGRLAVLLAIAACLLVTAVLARLGLPTSLTLATLGALVGAGLGFGFAVSWSTIGLLAAVGLGGPLAAAAVAALLSRGTRLIQRSVRTGAVTLAHLVTFGLASVAYSSNDGQRMLAMFAIAATGGTAAVSVRLWELVTIAICFTLGAAVGVYRYAGTLGVELVPARPHHAPVAELAAAAASFAGLSVGAPLSLTQSAAAGLIGAAGPQHWPQVRWQRAARLALAWVLTIPSAFLLGLLLGAAVAALS